MGTLIALFATLFLTVKDTLSKKISFSIDGTTSALASFLFAIPFYLILLAIIWLYGIDIFSVSPGFWVIVFARAFFDTLAESSKMQAFSNGELSAVTSIISLYPIFVLLLSPLITKDPLTTNIIFGAILTVTGSILVVFKPSKQTTKKGIIFALLSAVFFSLNTCFDKLSVQTANPIFSAFTMTLLSGLFLLPLVAFKTKTLGLLKTNTKQLWMRGFFQTVCTSAKLISLIYIQAAQWAVLARIVVLFSVISGGVIFNEGNVKRKIIGAVLSITGVALALLG